MSIPTCRVRAIINDSDSGQPIRGARVQAQLSTYEVYQGYVVPKLVQAVTDEDGFAYLDLFPNQLGSVESFYNIKILAPNGKNLRTTAVVPNAANIDLHIIAELPPYDGKNDGQLFIDEAIAAGIAAIVARDQAEGFAAAAQASAVAAAGSAADAAASAGTVAGAVIDAQAAAVAAAGSATAAAGSATAAANSAAAAAASQSAASASETSAAASATDANAYRIAAADSALVAAGSEQAANASAGAAAGSAAAAANSATAAAGSASDASDSATATKP